MKFESDEKNFSLNMNSFPDMGRAREFQKAGTLIKKNQSLFFSIISIAVALSNIAFGLFINLSNKLLSNVWESNNYHFIVVMLIVSLVMSVVSVTLGILALVYYHKSPRHSLDKVAVFVAVLSFILSITALVLDFVGLLIW